MNIVIVKCKFKIYNRVYIIDIMRAIDIEELLE